MKKIVKLICAILLGLLSLNFFGSIAQAETNSNNEVQLNPELGPGYYPIQKKTRMKRSVSTNPPQFLAEIKTGALDTWKKYQILPSITAAQAALESGWGTSKLSTQANNLFGIKGTYNGKSVTMPTKEFIDGKWITVNAKFRKYPSKRESIIDHGVFLQKARYQNLVGVTDYKKVAKLLQQDGYATAPDYASTLISIINGRNLTSLDREAYTRGNVKWVYGLDVMSVRERPDWNSATVFQTYKYKSLQVNWDVKKGSWYQVMLDGKIGWMQSRYFTAKKPFNEYKVRDAVANFRTGAGWNNSVAYQLKKNQVISVSNIEKPQNGFYPCYFRGKKGWMPLHYLVHV